MMTRNFSIRHAAFTVCEQSPPDTVSIFVNQLGVLHIPSGIGVLITDCVVPPSPRKELQLSRMNFLINQNGKYEGELAQSAIPLFFGEDVPIQKLLLDALKGGVVKQHSSVPNGRSYEVIVYEVTARNDTKSNTHSYRRMVARLSWLMRKEFRRYQDRVNDKSFINY